MVDDCSLADDAADRPLAAVEDRNCPEHRPGIDQPGAGAALVPDLLHRLERTALVVGIEHPGVARRIEQRIAAAGQTADGAPLVARPARELGQVASELHAAHAADVAGRVACAGIAVLDHGYRAAEPA